MKAIVILFLAVFSAATGFGRLVADWPVGKLMAESDLVVEATVLVIRRSDEILEGHGDSKQFIAHRATLSIQKVVKGRSDMKVCEMLFFGYADSTRSGFNGSLFISPSLIEQGRFLLYLKGPGPILFSPTTGHYDAALSVKQITGEEAAEPGATDNPVNAQ